jgi:hypothetical protein
MWFRRRHRTSEAQARDALARGISAICSLQQTDGCFPFSRWVGGEPAEDCHPLFATLTVVLAVGSLLPVDAVSRAVDFVRCCRRTDGTWEFDPALEIPADSDDTACALTVIARHAPHAAGPKDAALLRLFWRHPTGPFATWRAEGAWAKRNRDDAVVNCNILLALRLLGAHPSAEELESVTHLVGQSGAGCRYYCSPTTIAYAASRAGIPLGSLPARLASRPKPKQGVQPMAQWLTAVQRWDEYAVAQVVAAQTEAGCWDAEPWCTGAGPYVWGSRAVNTALCIEALDAALASTPARWRRDGYDARSK